MRRFDRRPFARASNVRIQDKWFLLRVAVCIRPALTARSDKACSMSCPNLVDSVRALAYIVLQPDGGPRPGEETALDVRTYLVRSGDLSITDVPIQVVLWVSNMAG